LTELQMSSRFSRQHPPDFPARSLPPAGGYRRFEESESHAFHAKTSGAWRGCFTPPLSSGLNRPRRRLIQIRDRLPGSCLDCVAAW
jgi:hypothetical protein